VGCFTVPDVLFYDNFSDQDDFDWSSQVDGDGEIAVINGLYQLSATDPDSWAMSCVGAEYGPASAIYDDILVASIDFTAVSDDNGSALGHDWNGSAIRVQTFPSLFTHSTTINFEISRSGHLSLLIYDLNDRHIRTLVNRVVAAGIGHTVWKGHDQEGKTAPAGIYFYQARFGDQVARGKVQLVR
jgi:hypothetical protein